MPRHRKRRKMGNFPIMKGFAPFGISKFDEDFITVQLEEYESLRLSDYLNLTHDEASVKMGISRSTFTRIYESVRKKIAKAFVEGKKIIIEGGNVELDNNWLKCLQCGKIFKTKVTDEQREVRCSYCDSEDTFNLERCFFRGCKRCKRCI